MRGKAPTVSQFMTHLPEEIERLETVGEAMALMDRLHIRHIPVVGGGHLKGVVSQRDILVGRTIFGGQLATKSVQEIWQEDVLTVSPVTAVDEVAERMLDRGVGSAVVVDGGFVVGIFTTTDALRVLSQLFRPSS
jgi:acetoin utilization protein AcuB